jgi:hypothetical protein
MGETPFRLIYGTDAVIQLEISEPSRRVMYTSLENDKLLKEDLDLIHETLKMTRVNEIS